MSSFQRMSSVLLSQGEDREIRGEEEEEEKKELSEQYTFKHFVFYANNAKPQKRRNTGTGVQRASSVQRSCVCQMGVESWR